MSCKINNVHKMNNVDNVHKMNNEDDNEDDNNVWNDIIFESIFESIFKSTKKKKHYDTYFYPQSFFLSNPKPSLTDISKVCSTWYNTLAPIYNLIPYALSYLSIWNILFPCLLELGMKTRRYTTVVCSVGGAYMTWVHPVDIPVHYLSLYVEFPSSIVMDFLVHQLPFFYTWGFPWDWDYNYSIHYSNYYYNYYYTTLYEKILGGLYPFFLTRWIVILYALLIGVENTKKKYNVKEIDIITIIVFSEIFFFFFQL